jgi:SEC-C motif-containing protein
MPDTPCPCSPKKLLTNCCGRYHTGEPAPTAEALMRSRYSAFALGLTGYIRDTTRPDQQAGLDMQDIADWSHSNQWLGLRLHRTGAAGMQPRREFVDFSAHYCDAEGKLHEHRELSLFVHLKGRWYFIQPD